MVHAIANVTGLARTQWTPLWRSPYPWVLLAFLVVVTQAGLWSGIAWDDGFDARQPLRVFSIVLNALAFMVPVFSIVLMGAMHRVGWGNERPPRLLAARVIVVVLSLALIAVVSFAAMLPGLGVGRALVAGPEMVNPFPFPSSWEGFCALMGRAILIAVPYATLCALICLLTKSGFAGTFLACVYAVMEYILFDLTLGWFSLFEWVPGLLLGQMYTHWLGNPDTTLGAMRNLLRLEDDLQGLVVVAFHTLWLSAAVCVGS